MSHWPSPLSEQAGTTDCHLRGLRGLSILPSKVCVVKNILLCLHSNSQIWSVLKSRAHHRHCGLTPPPSGSSPHPSMLPDTAQENPEKSIRLAHPQKQQPAIRRLPKGGGKRGVGGQLLGPPASVQVSYGHYHIHLPPFTEAAGALGGGAWLVRELWLPHRMTLPSHDNYDQSRSAY